MQPKLLQMEHALYLVEEWNGENDSGLIPWGDLILVRSDECAPYTAGGMLHTDEVRERMTMATQTGIIVAMGTEAFAFTLGGKRMGDDVPRPKIGDRIWHPKYAGDLYQGFDKKAYRMMRYTVVGGIFDPEKAPYIPPPPASVLASFKFPTGHGQEQGEAMSIPGAENVGDSFGGPIINLDDGGTAIVDTEE